MTEELFTKQKLTKIYILNKYLLLLSQAIQRNFLCCIELLHVFAETTGLSG